MGQWQHPADRLQPGREVLHGKKGAGQQELWQGHQVREGRDRTFRPGESADDEAESHEDDQSEQRKYQHLRKGRPSVDQGEIKGEMSYRQDHDGRQQLENNPAKSLPDDDRRAADGGGEESLQYQRLPEVVEKKGHTEDAGAEQGESQLPRKDEVDRPVHPSGYLNRFHKGIHRAVRICRALHLSDRPKDDRLEESDPVAGSGRGCYNDPIFRISRRVDRIDPQQRGDASFLQIGADRGRILVGHDDIRPVAQGAGDRMGGIPRPLVCDPDHRNGG